MFREFASRTYVYSCAGDNIDGGTATDAIKSMDQAFAPVIAAKIPWAAILGNHDQESNLPRAKVMEYLTKMDYSMSEVLNPSMENLLGKSIDRRAPIEVHGYGNYYLQVFGALGTDSANSSLLNLYFLDSGDYSKFDTVGGYDWVRASQLLWFETLATKLRVILFIFLSRVRRLLEVIENNYKNALRFHMSLSGWDAVSWRLLKYF